MVERKVDPEHQSSFLYGCIDWESYLFLPQASPENVHFSPTGGTFLPTRRGLNQPPVDGWLGQEG
jgi:hypothetical protein